MSNLSVVILSKNSESSIKEVLTSVKFADEIIVIDDFSTDSTKTIATKLSVPVYQRKLNNNFSAQRNFGLKKAKSAWVLFLDSDEMVSPELAKEIILKISDTQIDGYFLKRTDTLFGKRLKHGETGSVQLLRLAKKNAGKWIGMVHETWEIEGKTETLENPLIHQSHLSLESFWEKLNFYSSIEADYRFQHKLPVSVWQVLAFPILKFLYTFVYLKGFRDGWQGLILAYFMALHSLFVRIKHLELVKKHIKPLTSKTSLVSRIEQILFYGICVSIGLGQLLRYQVSQNTAIYLHDILIPLFISLIFCHLFVNKPSNVWRKLIFKDKLTLGILGVFIIWIWITWILNLPGLGIVQSQNGLMYLIRFSIYSLFGFSLLYANFNLKKQIPIGILLLLMAAVLIGLYQYIFFPDTRLLFKLGWDDHLNRLTFPWFDPGFTGLIFGLGFFWVWSQRKSESWLQILLFLGVMLTYSRASILALFLGLGFIFISKANWRKQSLVWIFLLGFIYFLLPQTQGEGVDLTRIQSIESRVSSTQSGVEIFKHNPILGIGFNNYKQTSLQNNSLKPYHPSSPDNSFVFIFTVSGIIGGILFGLFVFQLLVGYLKMESLLPVFSIVISSHSLFNNSWFYPFVYILFLIYLVWEISTRQK